MIAHPTRRAIAPLMIPVVQTRDLDRIAHHRVMIDHQLMLKTTIDGNVLGVFSTYGPAEAAACEALSRDCACLSCGDYSLAPMCAACAESDPPTGDWGDTEPGEGTACEAHLCHAPATHMLVTGANTNQYVCCTHYPDIEGEPCNCAELAALWAEWNAIGA